MQSVILRKYWQIERKNCNQKTHDTWLKALMKKALRYLQQLDFFQ
jgi:hypothetical protein